MRHVQRLNVRGGRGISTKLTKLRARDRAVRLAIEPMEPRLLFAVFSVTGTTDGVGAISGTGAFQATTLRAAINAANSAGGASTINLPAGTYTINDSGFGSLAILSAIDLEGAGATATVINATGSGNPIFKISIPEGNTDTINGVTIEDGSGPGFGGGIQISEAVATSTTNLTNDLIGDNTAQGNGTQSYGGGISVDGGTLNLVDSTVSNNTVSGIDTEEPVAGGGIALIQGVVNVRFSTISANMAQGSAGVGSGGSAMGGGIANLGGTLNIVDSTVANNQAIGGADDSNTGSPGSSDGGGVFATSATTIRSSTIAFNSAGAGGGIYSGGANTDISIRNSIVAKDTGGDAATSGGGIINSVGNNLVGVNNGSFTAPGDLTGTSTSPLDPKFTSTNVQNNGGPTQTLLPAVGSPAIDAGSNALNVDIDGSTPITTDQRGLPRVFNKTIDIGADEVSSIIGVASTAAASYNLTTLGTTDWAHWGTGDTVNGFDHKSGGGGLISNVTRVGSGDFGAYSDPSRKVSWTDGIPDANDTGDSAYIWANNGIGAGYSFTVPADTNTRTLYVYVGGYSSGSTLTAHLSGGTTSDYSVSFSGSGIYSDIVAITYTAESDVETLTLTYVKSQNINGTGGSADLIAAWLGNPVGLVSPTAVNDSYEASEFSALIFKGPGVLSNDTAPNGEALTATLLTPTVHGTLTFDSNGDGGFVYIPSGKYVGTDSFTYKATDTDGLSATATATINVTGPVPGSLTGNYSTTVPAYNLTSLGTSDWAHWGTGVAVNGFDHKADGGSQISNVTRVGSGNFGAYSDPSRDVSWTDGTPLASDAGDHGYIWANDGIGAGYSFTAPADTTTRTLYIYVGGYSSGSNLTAHLSDSSATDFTVNLFPSAGLYGYVVALTYNATTAGQTLTITYTKTQNVNGTGGSADLIAAWLVGPAVPVPPTAVNDSYETSEFSVLINKGPGVLSNDTAPNGEALTATLLTTTQHGALTFDSNGDGGFVYVPSAKYVGTDSFTYKATDTDGLSSTATATINVTGPATGSITGASSTAAASYNLTSLGKTDWIHWGTGFNASAFDRKATGNSQISNVTRIGTGNFGVYHDPSRDVAWTDGTPLASDTGDQNYIWANNGIGAGYSFTAPADTSTRTIYVYVGGYSSGSTLTAHLSDNSATDFTVNLSGAAIYSDVVAITYNAANAGATLTISYTKSQNINGTGGSADLIAAWLG